jgi:hypothetical protein
VRYGDIFILFSCMIKKKESLRVYRFSDALLKQLADQLLANVARDKREFEQRGFNADKQSAIEKLIREFENIASDDFLEGLKITTTEAKDSARAEVEKGVRTLFVMAENVFGTKAGKYKTFGDSALTRLSDEQTVRNARGAVKAARLYQNDLVGEGLTEDFLITLEKYIVLLDEAIDTQVASIRDRNIAVEERVEVGNKLYAELIKLCNTGKDIFYAINEAKYNDYIIYNTPTGKAEDLPTATEEGEA